MSTKRSTGTFLTALGTFERALTLSVPYVAGCAWNSGEEATWSLPSGPLWPPRRGGSVERARVPKCGIIKGVKVMRLQNFRDEKRKIVPTGPCRRYFSA